MGLPQKHRVAIFAFGFTFGCVVVTIIFQIRGVPHQSKGPDPGVERRLVPGAFAQWMLNGRPVEGAFILSESLGPPAPDGTRVRALVTPGLDPNSFIRVEELRAPATGAEPRVLSWKFMFADRVRARLQPGVDTKAMADALRALGWRFGARDIATGWITIQLDQHEADAVSTAVAQLQAWPQWVLEVQPDFLPPPNPAGIHAP